MTKYHWLVALTAITVVGVCVARVFGNDDKRASKELTLLQTVLQEDVIDVLIGNETKHHPKRWDVHIVCTTKKPTDVTYKTWLQAKDEKTPIKKRIQITSEVVTQIELRMDPKTKKTATLKIDTPAQRRQSVSASLRKRYDALYDLLHGSA